MPKKIIVEEFDRVDKYIETIGKRKPNDVFKYESLSSDSRGSRSDDFSMTVSYAEATEIALSGYREGLDKLTAAGKKARHVEAAPKAMPTVGPVGYAPHVPNAITGVPFSMITKTEIEQKAKVITILYNIGVNCNIDADRVARAGKNVLNVIHTLETQGYRVALYVMNAHCKAEYAISVVQVKHWRQPSNPLKIAYPLVHPSFFRRHSFRWLETQPEVTDIGFTHGYGRALDTAIGDRHSTQKRRDWLRENGVLKEGWFFTEQAEAENCEAEQLIEKMGIIKKAEVAQ